MAWSWTESGRIDGYVFEKIPIKGIDADPSGELNGVIGGELNFSYDSSLKVSGSLDVTKTNFINNCYIRIWYTPTLNGEKKRIRLCTCYASTSNGHYEDGLYSGTIELKSVLLRHTGDKLRKNYTLAKGKSALAAFKAMFKWLGGTYAVKGMKDKKFTKNTVVEFGRAPMEVLQYIADFLGGEITCDTYGRTVLQKYTIPSKKPISYTIPSGAASVTLPGIDIHNSQANTPNYTAVRYQYTEGSGKNAVTREIIGTAAADSSSAISRNKCGRFITETYNLSDMSPKTKARADAIAASKLKSASKHYVTYKVRCFYLPIEIGQVVRFRYDDIDIDGLVSKIDMKLGDALTMDVTLRRVRKHG